MHPVHVSRAPISYSSRLQSLNSAENDSSSEQDQLTSPHQRSTLLHIFSRSNFRSVLTSPATKNLAGALFAFGFEIDYMGQQGRDFTGQPGADSMGGYGRAVAMVGMGLWLTSTVVSSINLPRRNEMPLHILKSVGHAIGGIAVMSLDYCLNKHNPNSVKNDLPESTHSVNLIEVSDRYGRTFSGTSSNIIGFTDSASTGPTSPV